MEKKTYKPNVIPSKEQMETAMSEKAKIEAYEAEKKEVVNTIYTDIQVPTNLPNENYDFLNQNNSIEMMRARTANQLKELKEKGRVQDPSLAENTASIIKTASELRNEEQIRLRDEALENNKKQTQNYQKYMEGGMSKEIKQYNMDDMSSNNNNVSGYNNNTGYVPPKPPVNNNFDNIGHNNNNSDRDRYIHDLSQPNHNAPFDVLPLPSKGKLYPGRRENIKVGFMTTADENILTSPNLVQSGEFLEILINRKLISNIRYKDLLPGDRNAIMIWLRATAYGEMYPITLLDENDEPFEAVINLNELKTKELLVEPNEEGLFEFLLPNSKNLVKFKLLTCGDVDDVEEMVKKDKEQEVLVNNATTYRFEKMIVDVNGNRDKYMIKDFANSMRIPDAKALDKYIDELECGIDLFINVPTPGGGSVATFLPLNFYFFWPNIKL